VALQALAETLRSVVAVSGNLKCRQIYRDKSCVTARIDQGKGRQIHRYVKGYPVGAATVRNFDAEGGDLG
jgi:hypothetical protein